MAEVKKVYNIGVEATMEVIGGKWKPIILCHLRNQKLRTGELKRAIPNITQKMLTQQLRELEDAEIVSRRVYEQVPPKVEYCLTEYGETLSVILNKLCVWGEKHIDLLNENGQAVELLHRDAVPTITSN